MGKKMMDFILEEMDTQEKQIKSVWNQFYSNGVLVDVVPSVDQAILADQFERARQSSVSEILTQEKLEEVCFKIRESVKEGKVGNLEIRFDQMEQLFERKKHLLGNTILKMCLLGEDPIIIYIKEGNAMDLRLFIGNENALAIMAAKDKNGEISYASLNEFHMLAFRENPDTKKEIGLMTSYTCQIGKVFSSIILSYNLAPIKSLLLADWLQAEWERAMEARKKSFDEEIEEEDNGQEE